MSSPAGRWRACGWGPKTAACVLLFALGRPAMPVDTHVYRVASRLPLIPPGTNSVRAHATLEALMDGDAERTYRFHVEMIAHGRAICQARKHQLSSASALQVTSDPPRRAYTMPAPTQAPKALNVAVVGCGEVAQCVHVSPIRSYRVY